MCYLEVGLLAGTPRERKVWGPSPAVVILLTVRGRGGMWEWEETSLSRGQLSVENIFPVLGEVLYDFVLGLENSWSLIKPRGREAVTEYSAWSLAEIGEAQLQGERDSVNTSGKARGQSRGKYADTRRMTHSRPQSPCRPFVKGRWLMTRSDC